MARHLFSSWPEVVSRLAAQHVLLLCDYDGTLTPIVERPELAELSEATRFLLQVLAKRQRYTVGIISGRALGELKRLVDICDAVFVGNHGLEIEGPGISQVNPKAEALRPLMAQIHSELREALAKTEGALVEDKGLTLSVHYRLVDESKVGQVRQALKRVVEAEPYLGRVRLAEGKKVYEVRPVMEGDRGDKGEAISFLLHSYLPSRYKGRSVPVFLGDDLTDEDGFRNVEEMGGLSILVREEEQQTKARYFLRSPLEVQEFLARLLDMDTGEGS